MQIRGAMVKAVLKEHEIWANCALCYFEFLPDQQLLNETCGQKLYDPIMKGGVCCPTCGDTKDVSFFLSNTAPGMDFSEPEYDEYAQEQ